MSGDDRVVGVFRKAAADRAHGAAEIEEALAGNLLALRPRWRAESLQEGAALLAEGQPGMANLRSLSEQATAGDLRAFQNWLERRLRLFEELPERLAANAWPAIQASRLIVTISRSSAVAAAIEGAWSRGWPGSVVVLDGTAAGRGWDQAQRLAAAGEAVSRPDASASAWLERPGAVVLVGADAVGPSRFVNATGTKNLLLLARAQEAIRVLVADTGKDVSEKVVAEILEGSPRHRDGQGREWSIFEGVALELVSVRVSELEGVC